MQTKALYNLQLYIDADDIKDAFHACAYFIRLHVLIWYVSTYLQRNDNKFVKKFRIWILFLIREMYWETSKEVW